MSNIPPPPAPPPIRILRNGVHIADEDVATGKITPVDKQKDDITAGLDVQKDGFAILLHTQSMEMPEANALVDVLHEVAAEVVDATSKWPPFNSAHEGFGVLLEEVDELKAHVWMKQKNRDPAAMRKEAIQIAAMAVRFAREICKEPTVRK